MKFYNELADWWHLVSIPEDYAEEAGLYMHAMEDAFDGELKTLLELGCGGGNNASHWPHLDLTLVDLSPDMIRQCTRLNPGARTDVGNMMNYDAGATFDAVFIHDAIGYLTDEEQLQATAHNAFRHLKPGGVALFVPDHTTEHFELDSGHGGHDAPDGSRGIRYLEWTHSRTDHHYLCEYVFAIREGTDVRTVHDRHVLGLFPQATWEAVMRDAGFDVAVIAFDHSEVDYDYVGFLGRK